ncbi:Type 1 glutamine amidotransferase-like domain-containing protein [Candidatus Babeliales bacterium]|nr:Type 1 glutamine amidotransferase-like domain-containing protein [Candidatus Babeliales bacterium]MBP9844385.1 Type 1 glutamine amidotransferase-like domain-containing protein [Candidatus Babeliales bacterium]
MTQQKFMTIGGERLNKELPSKIDLRIIELSGKSNPKILFIPTASLDDARYVQRFIDYFQFLGGLVDVLYLYKEQPTSSEIQEKIAAADVIYVGGGNTLRMMNLWRKLGVDILLHQAFQAGKVLCGTSAGSICWFNHGNSDSRKDNNPDADYIKVTALGFLNAMNCPHYNSESDRQASFKKMLKKYPGVGIALDDFAALEIVGNQYKIVTSTDKAQGYKLYWKDGFFHEQILDKKEYRPLADLFSK